jgi:hypothetical protein
VKNDSEKVFNIVEPMDLMSLERGCFEIICLLGQNLEGLFNELDIADTNITVLSARPVN